MISVDDTGTMVELVIGEPPVVYSHFVSPGEWCALVEKADHLEVVRRYRLEREMAEQDAVSKRTIARNLEDAKNAASHHARRTP